MKNTRAGFGALCLLATLLAVAAPPALAAASREEGRLESAKTVLAEMQRMPDQRVPDWLVQRAQGIAIIPQVIKVGLGVGGRGGRGVLVVRRADGSWSDPSFITLAGGSIGWQAGVQAADIVLVFTTRRSIEGITGGKLTLGVDAAVAAGPVGRSASAATDISASEIYSYSRAEGLFGGIAIDGTVIAIDPRANARFYGRSGILASEIFAGAVSAPASAEALRESIRRLGSGVAIDAPGAAAHGSGAPASGAVDRAPPARDPAPAAERGLESGGAATFPLEEPKNDRPPP
jgi:lipid-binding SYLF domain-containing protein